MTYRDDRDALVARIDALERELGEAKQELGAAGRERDAAREEAEGLRAELASAKKRLEKLGGSRPRTSSTPSMLIGGGVVTIVMLGVAIGTCSHRAKKEQGAATLAPPVDAAPPKPDASVAVTDKLVRDKILYYRSCTEWPDVDLRVGLRRYRAQVDLASGKVQRSWLGDAIFGIKRTGYCFDSLLEAAAKPPALAALDALAPSYHDRLLRLEIIAKRIDDYYHAGDFEDDELAGGKTYDSQLEVAWPGYLQVADELRARVSEVWEPLLDRARQRLEARGLHGDALALEVGREADALVELLLRPDATREELSVRLTKIEEAMAAVSAWVDAQPPGTSLSDAVRTVDAYGGDLRRALRALRTQWGKPTAQAQLEMTIDQARIQMNVAWLALDRSLGE